MNANASEREGVQGETLGFPRYEYAIQWCRRCGVELDGFAINMTCIECQSYETTITFDNPGNWAIRQDTGTILKNAGWITYTTSGYTTQP